MVYHWNPEITTSRCSANFTLLYFRKGKQFLERTFFPLRRMRVEPLKWKHLFSFAIFHKNLTKILFSIKWERQFPCSNQSLIYCIFGVLGFGQEISIVRDMAIDVSWFPHFFIAIVIACINFNILNENLVQDNHEIFPVFGPSAVLTQCAALLRQGLGDIHSCVIIPRDPQSAWSSCLAASQTLNTKTGRKQLR